MNHDAIGDRFHHDYVCFAPNRLLGPFFALCNTAFLIWVWTANNKEAAPTTHGSATWSSVKVAQERERIITKGMVLRDSWGFVLGRMPKVPDKDDPRLRYMGHMLTCAPTGAGKGIGAVIPNLLEYPGSALVLDIKGENYAVTKRARLAKKNEVFLVDPFGVTEEPGHAFNWLDLLKPDDPNVASDSAMLADMLVVADSRDGYWDDAAQDLIRGLMIHVAGFEAAKRNMGFSAACSPAEKPC